MRRHWLIAAVVMVLSLTWSGQNQAQGSVFVEFIISSQAFFDTSLVIELFDDTPLHQQNFLNYVNTGRYDNTFFHRGIDGFVLQGGSFHTPIINPSINPFTGELFGMGNPDGTLDTTFKAAGFVTATPVTTDAPVANEINRSNTRGTLALALPSDPNGVLQDAGTSGFFINQVNNVGLDSDFTVFGEVVQGMNVVDILNSPVLGVIDQLNVNADDFNNTSGAPGFDFLRDWPSWGPFGTVPFAFPLGSNIPQDPGFLIVISSAKELVPGDVNGDGAVDIADMALVGAQWMTDGTGNQFNADISPHPFGDGSVDIGDMALLGANWDGTGGGTSFGGGTAIPTPGAAAAGILLLGTIASSRRRR